MNTHLHEQLVRERLDEARADGGPAGPPPKAPTGAPAGAGRGWLRAHQGRALGGRAGAQAGRRTATSYRLTGAADVAREASHIAPPSGLRVNRKSAVPVHVQLQTQIRHLINIGSLKPGMQLPTVRQLAGFLRINRNTVARALADLDQDGYLESHQGRGTFVADRPPAHEGRAARSLERLVRGDARAGAAPRLHPGGADRDHRGAGPGRTLGAAGQGARAAGRVQSRRADALPRAARGRAADRASTGCSWRSSARACASRACSNGLPRGDHHVLPHPRGQAGHAARRPARRGAPRRGEHRHPAAAHRAAGGHDRRPRLQ